MTMHPFDLQHLITGDHDMVETIFQRLERGEGNRQALIDQVIMNVAIHAGAEEQVFYPALTELGDEATAEENLAEHQPLKDALVALDRFEAGSPEAEDALRTVIDGVRMHREGEEHQQLPWMREKVGDERMVELGKTFQDHARRAPTRAHPHSPSNPLVATPAALVDKVRDKVGKRDEEAATDASGRLDPQAQALVDTFAALGVMPPHLLEPPAARKQPTAADAVKAMMDERGEKGPEPVGDVAEHRLPGPGGDITVRTYRPLGTDGGLLPVLVYVHGGGWVIADLDTYDASCRGLANRAGCMVASVEYRHAPEAPFPAAHEDVLAATRWFMANASELGGDPTRVAICGESAGGNMAAATCISLAKMGEPLPVCQVLVYPVTSTGMDTPSYADAADAKPLYSAFMSWFLGHTIATTADLSDPRLDLMSVPAEQLAGLPPAVVITAERDPLRDEGEAFAERLRSAGVKVDARRYDGMMHEFFGAAAVLDKAALAQDQAAAALRAAFGVPALAGRGR